MLLVLCEEKAQVLNDDTLRHDDTTASHYNYSSQCITARIRMARSLILRNMQIQQNIQLLHNCQ
jgi:hypothetical protein